MHNAVCSEIIKFRRNKMAWMGTLIIASIPLFMIWNRLVIDPQREYMEWLMSVLMLNTLILPIVNGFVITSSMQREYQNRTIRNVLTAPVSREKFLTAKLVVWFLWYLISFYLSEMIVIVGCYVLFPVEFTTGNMRYALSLFTQNYFFSFIVGIPIHLICVKQQALFYPSMLATLGSAVLQAVGLQVSEELTLPACVCPWTAVSISAIVGFDTYYYWICLVSIFLCGVAGYMGVIISFRNQEQ
ncbi:ABC transporter permease [Parablautia intestinalis]|uniref:ABC transporter permease n=1 Tax=Parablautia intestinalis TaxID=2320100 RepID=UPI00259CB4D9|nr:ABC transporter permease [Parablautia intestinalis]